MFIYIYIFFYIYIYSYTKNFLSGKAFYYKRLVGIIKSFFSVYNRRALEVPIENLRLDYLFTFPSTRNGATSMFNSRFNFAYTSEARLMITWELFHRATRAPLRTMQR